jgi:hypothetical protein
MALRDSIKDIKNLAVGMENLELISKLIDLQAQAYEILDENRELRLKLEEIQRQEEVGADLEYLPDLYYKKSDGSGPYCPVCWDTKNILVNIPIGKFTTGWHGNCRSCGASRLKVPANKIPNK